MKRREFLKYSAATAVTSSFSFRRAVAETPPIKVGLVGAKTVVLLTPAEIDEAAKRQVTYTPPGK